MPLIELRFSTFGGTGAGLTVVKAILRRFGRKIWVESQFGGGSTFCFSLPEGGRSS